PPHPPQPARAGMPNHASAVFPNGHLMAARALFQERGQCLTISSRGDGDKATTETQRHGDSVSRSSQDHSSNSILEYRSVEVEQQSDPQAAQLQICQELRLVYSEKRLDGLQFDDQR